MVQNVLKVLSFISVVFLIACEGPDPDSNWKERDDLIGPNGEVITGEQAEKAGLAVYSVLKWILKEESYDTLAVSESKLPWVALEEQDLHLDWLEKIKDGYTFTIKKGRFNAKKALPTFYYRLGTFPLEDDKLQAIGRNWLLKNHSYNFRNYQGENVAIAFFIEPAFLKVRAWTSSSGRVDRKGGGSKTVSTITYEAEMLYEPEDEDEEIASGEVSFDIYALTGYTRVEIDGSAVGGKINIDGTTFRLLEFTKDFAVLDKLTKEGKSIGVAAFAGDGKQYRTQPKRKQLQLFNGKAGKLNVNKIVWDYVKSQKYKLNKEKFLEWFASNILSKQSQYSDEEKKKQYAIVYSIGDMDRLILSSKVEEKLMTFNMKLK